MNLDKINSLQTDIMLFITSWIKQEKTPVPKQEIIIHLKAHGGIKDFTTINALNTLIKKGYIRRAHIETNRTAYVQLRMFGR